MVRPIFWVVLRDGPHWSVETEWPDGTVEHVDTFKAHSEAANWVRTRSEGWLRERQIEKLAASPSLQPSS